MVLLGLKKALGINRRSIMNIGIKVYFSTEDLADWFIWEMLSPPRIGDIIYYDGDWIVDRVGWGTPNTVGVLLKEIEG